MQPTRAAITEWMIQFVMSTLEIPRDAFTVEASFDSYGLDSLELVVMAGLMEEAFNIEIDADQVFKASSIRTVADALAGAGVVQADA